MPACVSPRRQVRYCRLVRSCRLIVAGRSAPTSGGHPLGRERGRVDGRPHQRALQPSAQRRWGVARIAPTWIASAHTPIRLAWRGRPPMPWRGPDAPASLLLPRLGVSTLFVSCCAQHNPRSWRSVVG